ncbi:MULTISPECIES: FGGY-family carbohydrate kinase [unclassified Rhodococcus (in: high G+C Gram-positive bacteria)]|uniref:FGGY-family carbohydrate kinase n=1 Tax=unclassified Rhodococcus (in: high G+C Gram-positive bacteria) TaxID=192944 RepID=UPI00163A3D70|nr:MULTISPECIES: FGGY-family carbohydrate kinase [unclassified Rhodococcus (in: high G+C Gram-positive bacteria)]MBC2641221.1 hypothetical protein [Rhodococcus sp. 3A]MBC2894033.1 hypothetical protein [Rhodococcus sp. 4CII]
MTRGLGLSIGTVHAVAAVAGEDGVRAGLIRSATLKFGAPSTVRLGDPPDTAGVVAAFANRVGRVVVAGDGSRYTGQDLVAAAAHCLIAEVAAPDETPIVLTHPAVHTPRMVAAQRAALDRAGLTRVGLVPEPVAALAWAEWEHGPLGDGVALVYHLGDRCLDLTIVTFGAAGGPDPIVGRPLRSTEFSARGLAAEREDAVAAALSGTLELVADCLAVAHLSAADLDVVVLTGGAADVPAVGELLSTGLATPVVRAPEPATTALGAAVLAAASHRAAIGPTTPPDSSRSWTRAAAVAAVAAATLVAVPLFADSAAPNPASPVVAAPRPVAGHGVRIVEQAERPHIPAGSAVALAPAPAPLQVDYVLARVPALESPALVAVAAPAEQVVLDTPVETERILPTPSSAPATVRWTPPTPPAIETTPATPPQTSEPPATPPEPTTEPPETDPPVAPESEAPEPSDSAEPGSES